MGLKYHGIMVNTNTEAHLHQPSHILDTYSKYSY